MSKFPPQGLKKSEVRQVFDEHLAQFRRNMLHEHIRQLQAGYGEELEMPEALELVAKLEEERSRLIDLAEEDEP